MNFFMVIKLFEHILYFLPLIILDIFLRKRMLEKFTIYQNKLQKSILTLENLFKFNLFMK